MATDAPIDALKVLDALDAELDSSLQASLEERLTLVANKMQEVTHASGAWISWVLPRHERKPGKVGAYTTSKAMPASFVDVVEKTRILGAISSPSSQDHHQGSWVAAPLAIERKQPFGAFGLAYEDASQMPENARELAHWVASRLDSEIHALSIGSTLHQFNTALDHCCDQNDIQQALTTCLKTYREYSESASVALIYCAPGHTAQTPDTFGLCVQESGTTTFPISIEEYQNLVESDDQNAVIKKLLNHDFDSSLSQILVERDGQQNKPFGYVVSMGAQHKYRDPFELQLLQTLAMRLDSRLTNFHLLKLKLCRFIDARVATQIAMKPNHYDQILTPSRQNIAMLYADIVGFSRLSEIHPGDLIAQITTEFLNAFQQIVFKRHGIYDKAVGDCGIALFGFPLEHSTEIDTQAFTIQSVLSGLEVLESIGKLSDKYFDTLHETLTVSMGIAIGPTLVGLFGPEHAREFTAMGRFMNLAARVQAAASPGELLITEEMLSVLQEGSALSDHRLSIGPEQTVTLKNIGERRVFSIHKS